MNNIGKMTVGLLMALTLVGCSSDDDEQPGQEVTLTIPIEIYSANPEVQSSDAKTRAALPGDPGNDVVFEQPLYLYIYACVGETQNGSETYELLYKEFIYPSSTGQDLSPYTWKLEDENTVKERWTKDVDVTFKITEALTDESRVFAIASRDDLSSKFTKKYSATQTGTNLRSDVEAMTLDLSDFTSDQLKDIYSTPLKDDNNGVITITTNNNVTTLTCSAVRLYHVAAKVDFTWEVASKIQSTTELASITCIGLPTTCKVFEPTNNPTTNTADVLLLGASADNPVNEVNAGNKWLGRAYAFMLQPPTDGKINYTVKFGGTANRAEKSASIKPTTLNNVFTGWYRVIATVE